MPRVQFTVRRLMIAVAITALPMALVSLALRAVRDEHRRAEIRRRAYNHKNMAFHIWHTCLSPDNWMPFLEPSARYYGGDELLGFAGDSPDLNTSPTWERVLQTCPPEDRAEAIGRTERHKYHKRMQAKWENALLHLWDPVPADPTPPAANLPTNAIDPRIPYGSLE